MNCDEVPGWDNLLSNALNSSNDDEAMETDASQVVPDLNSTGSFPSGDVQTMAALSSSSSSSISKDSFHDEGLGRDRSSSMSSWKSCSSLTSSGYMSDENQTLSPMYLMEDEPLPLSPDGTIIDLDASSPNVLETLGPTGMPSQYC